MLHHLEGSAVDVHTIAFTPLFSPYILRDSLLIASASSTMSSSAVTGVEVFDESGRLANITRATLPVVITLPIQTFALEISDNDPSWLDVCAFWDTPRGLWSSIGCISRSAPRSLSATLIVGTTMPGSTPVAPGTAAWNNATANITSINMTSTRRQSRSTRFAMSHTTRATTSTTIPSEPSLICECYHMTEFASFGRPLVPAFELTKSTGIMSLRTQLQVQQIASAVFIAIWALFVIIGVFVGRLVDIVAKKSFLNDPVAYLRSKESAEQGVFSELRRDLMRRHLIMRMLHAPPYASLARTQAVVVGSIFVAAVLYLTALLLAINAANIQYLFLVSLSASIMACVPVRIFQYLYTQCQRMINQTVPSSLLTESDQQAMEAAAKRRSQKQALLRRVAERRKMEEDARTRRKGSVSSNQGAAKAKFQRVRRGGADMEAAKAAAQQIAGGGTGVVVKEAFVFGPIASDEFDIPMVIGSAHKAKLAGRVWKRRVNLAKAETLLEDDEDIFQTRLKLKVWLARKKLVTAEHKLLISDGSPRLKLPGAASLWIHCWAVTYIIWSGNTAMLFAATFPGEIFIDWVSCVVVAVAFYVLILDPLVISYGVYQKQRQRAQLAKSANWGGDAQAPEKEANPSIADHEFWLIAGDFDEDTRFLAYNENFRVMKGDYLHTPIDAIAACKRFEGEQMRERWTYRRICCTLRQTDLVRGGLFSFLLRVTRDKRVRLYSSNPLAPYGIQVRSSEPSVPAWRCILPAEFRQLGSGGSGDDGTTIVRSHGGLAPWIAVDFGPQRSVLPVGYSLRAGWVNKASESPQTWIVQGSLDGILWFNMREHSRETLFSGPNDERYYEIPAPRLCRWVRLLVLSSVSGKFLLAIGGFEIFGTLSEFRRVELPMTEIECGPRLPVRRSVPLTRLVSLRHRAPGDMSGLIYWLGTAADSLAEFEDPCAVSNMIVMHSDEPGRLMKGTKELIVGRKAAATISTWDSQDSWFAFDFGIGRQLRLTTYLLKGVGREKLSALRWLIEGSDDGILWHRVAEGQASGDETVHVGWVSNEPFAYDDDLRFAVRAWRYLRIMQKGHNVHGNNCFELGGVEFYGSLLEREEVLAMNHKPTQPSARIAYMALRSIAAMGRGKRLVDAKSKKDDEDNRKYLNSWINNESIETNEDGTKANLPPAALPPIRDQEGLAEAAEKSALSDIESTTKLHGVASVLGAVKLGMGADAWKHAREEADSVPGEIFSGILESCAAPADQASLQGLYEHERRTEHAPDTSGVYNVGSHGKTAAKSSASVRSIAAIREGTVGDLAERSQWGFHRTKLPHLGEDFVGGILSTLCDHQSVVEQVEVSMSRKTHHAPTLRALAMKDVPVKAKTSSSMIVEEFSGFGEQIRGGVSDSAVVDIVGSDTTPAWLQLDFGGHRSVVVSSYTLKYGGLTPEHSPMRWTLEGGWNGDDWFPLRMHRGETPFSAALETKNFEVPSALPVRFLRMRLEPEGDSMQGRRMLLAGFEIYGEVIEMRRVLFLPQSLQQHLREGVPIRDVICLTRKGPGALDVVPIDSNHAESHKFDQSKSTGGIIEWIGSGGTTRPTRNPARGGYIRVTCSDINGVLGTGEVHNFVSERRTLCVTSDEPGDKWFTVDFGEFRRVSVTSYRVGHGLDIAEAQMRSWQLQGSINGHEWKPINAQNGNVRIKQPDDVALADVAFSRSTFRFLRLLQTTRNASKDLRLAASAFEIWGTLVLTGGDSLSQPLLDDATKEIATLPGVQEDSMEFVNPHSSLDASSAQTTQSLQPPPPPPRRHVAPSQTIHAISVSRRRPVIRGQSRPSHDSLDVHSISPPAPTGKEPRGNEEHSSDNSSTTHSGPNSVRVSGGMTSIASQYSLASSLGRYANAFPASIRNQFGMAVGDEGATLPQNALNPGRGTQPTQEFDDADTLMDV